MQLLPFRRPLRSPRAFIQDSPDHITDFSLTFFFHRSRFAKKVKKSQSTLHSSSYFGGNAHEQDTFTTAMSGGKVRQSTETPDFELNNPAVFPRPADVLLGRTKFAFQHIGNVRYRDMIDAAVEGYQQSPNREEKTKVIVDIVSRIKNSGGRFLRMERGSWRQISDRASREKVGHSFRDQAAFLRKNPDCKRQSPILPEAAKRMFPHVQRPKTFHTVSDTVSESRVGHSNSRQRPLTITKSLSFPALKSKPLVEARILRPTYGSANGISAEHFDDFDLGTMDSIEDVAPLSPADRRLMREVEQDTDATTDDTKSE